MSAALHVLQAAIACLIVLGLLWACRFVWRRSRAAGLMLAAGLLTRAAGGAFFLVTSYFRLPFLPSLQMGNGFWTVASDAQEYYRLGSLVAARWQETITPGYVGPLALWMRLAGVNPASPILLAFVMYALAVVALVAVFGRGRTRAAQQALHLGVAALSFSPMFVYAAVFGLKDVFFTTLVVIMGIAYLTVLVGAAWTRTTRTTNLLAAAVGIPAIWLIAGTRAYFAILLWAAIAVTYAGCFVAGVPSRRRCVAQAAVVLPVFAVVVSAGAEGNYPRFVRHLVASIPAAVIGQRAAGPELGLEELDHRRATIDDYGGNSVLRRRTGAGFSRVEALAVGLGALFVPASILGRLADVDLQIGAAARLIGDLDTVVFDATAAVILWIVIVNRRQINPPPLLFGLALAVLVALPLAYVMTNYGTLVRLRLLVAAPLWLVTLALAPGFAGPAARDRSDPVVGSV